jgi:hypothetical protein
MAKKSRERVVRRLRDAESRRARIVDELTIADALIIGSLSIVERRCGTPTCRCAKGPGHPQAILMSAEEGRRRCQLVRQDDVPVVRASVKRYRAFREALRLLSTLDSNILTLLKELLALSRIPYQ